MKPEVRSLENAEIEMLVLDLVASEVLTGRVRGCRDANRQRGCECDAEKRFCSNRKFRFARNIPMSTNQSFPLSFAILSMAATCSG